MKRLAILLVCPLFAAADWPQFRGPGGDGQTLARNLPATWDATTNIAWKTALPGKGWSSPVLVGGRLYLTAAVPLDPGSASSSELSLRALCVDAATGKQLWNNEVFRQDEA